MHTPVLLNEILEILDPRPGETVVDGTFGAGGHARALLERIGPEGFFLGVDWAQNAAIRGEQICAGRHNCRVEHGNYAELPMLITKFRFSKPDILFLDLGFSTEELEESGRGFSFLRDEPLDMRFDPGDGRPAAAEILNRSSERDLEEILQNLGEEKFARRIASAIVETRRKRRILRVPELVECIERAVPRPHLRTRIHPATRTFQALRIFVNDELDNVRKILAALPSLMAPRGRVGIISFHSLEDRIVKNSFRDFAKQSLAVPLTKKVIRPGRAEVLSNPRSRSAKFRAIRFSNT